MSGAAAEKDEDKLVVTMTMREMRSLLAEAAAKGAELALQQAKPEPVSKRWETVPQAAKRYGVSEDTVIGWIDRGGAPARTWSRPQRPGSKRKQPRTIRIPIDEFDAWHVNFRTGDTDEGKATNDPPV